jgi:hypothetical protein
VVDTTGFGSPEREGGGKSTFTGNRLNFVHLNLESDSEDEEEEEDEEEDNDDSYDGNKFGARGGRIKLQEKASLLNSTSGGGGETLRSKELPHGKVTNDNHHHRIGDLGFRDSKGNDLDNNDVDEDENDIGLGVLSPVERRGEGDRIDNIFDEDEALDQELHDASGLPSKPSKQQSSSFPSPSPSSSTRTPSVFFGLLDQSTRTLPLGKGRPHPQDRKNAAAAKALREAEARRKAEFDQR